jgi:poly(3-hydroxybutyrate) depolymerase
MRRRHLLYAVCALGVGAIGLGYRMRALLMPGARHFGPEVPDVMPAAADANTETRAIGERSYLVVTPARSTATGGKLPVLLVIHGDGGSAESVRRYTAFDSAVAGRAVVLYAQTKGRLWGVGTGRTAGEVSYLETVVADAAAKDPALDVARVFVFGWSSGAYIAQSFACGRKEVKGMALSGARVYAPCATQKPTLVFHNTGDQAHLVADGDALVAELAQRAHCSAERVAGPLEPCMQSTGCSVPVAYCRVEGGTHFPWKSTARASWKFFEAL